jgi:putative tryptophan/tyrosine transport system substrate-binding protein
VRDAVEPRRRKFMALIGAVSAWPLSARAQQSQRVRTIGILLNADETEADAQRRLAAFRRGMNELGWVEGKNFRVELRWGRGDRDLVQSQAQQLVGIAPDVILTNGTPSTVALQRETSKIPIVFAQVTDPVGEGLVASLSRPGGNITGFSAYDSEMGGKWMELLKEFAPGVTRAALLFNPRTAPGGGTRLIWPHLEIAARRLSVEPVAMPVASAADIERSLRSHAAQPGAGLVVMPDGFMFLNSALVVEFANAMRIPAIYPFRRFATIGGLMTYGVDGADLNVRAASYVDRILKGAKPSDLPVQAPTKYETVINLKTARAQGLTVPPALQVGADEVIE